ncbi:GNAT family N-acetyltransferase [Microbacterium proteolyticum]|uniref:GNAT family N-acetyltransferase n=1 Tax=Microbacterium proteolyticum TaxID=1572644 RepID=UPI0024175F75|nr:GNAT family N-acetyltransferase [Microbacterium proteolyticum]
MTASSLVTIRGAVESDTEAICDFGSRYVADFYAPILGAEAAQSQVDTWWSDAAMRPAVVAGTVIIALRDGEIVGVAQVDIDLTPPMIWKLYVHPSLRGSGVGPRLLDAIEAILPADATSVGIEHFTANTRAGDFYEREGFLVDRVEDAASGDPRLRVTWRVKQLR